MCAFVCLCVCVWECVRVWQLNLTPPTSNLHACALVLIIIINTSAQKGWHGILEMLSDSARSRDLSGITRGGMMEGGGIICIIIMVIAFATSSFYVYYLTSCCCGFIRREPEMQMELNIPVFVYFRTLISRDSADIYMIWVAYRWQGGMSPILNQLVQSTLAVHNPHWINCAQLAANALHIPSTAPSRSRWHSQCALWGIMMLLKIRNKV